MFGIFRKRDPLPIKICGATGRVISLLLPQDSQWRKKGYQWGLFDERQVVVAVTATKLEADQWTTGFNSRFDKVAV